MRQLSIKVRTRTPKEALNLGFMVARRYGFSLLLAVLGNGRGVVAEAAL